MSTYKTDNYNPDYVVHPGATLAETLEVLNMTQSELAKRTSRPEKTISEIINGQTAITPETALQFELALGVPATFWNNLEKNYREIKAKLDAQKKLIDEHHAARAFDYKEMSKCAWLPVTRNPQERVENLLKFFGVTSLSVLPELNAGVFRQAKNDGYSKENLVAWLRQGDREATKIETEPFDRKRLMEKLPELRALTMDVENFGIKMRDICASCGVALAFVQHLPKTYVIGATRWLGTDKVLVQMTTRGSFSDIFWFTFFHELGHVLLHKKKEKFIDYEKNHSVDSIEEKEADEFASELLIPKSQVEKFISENEVNVESIRKFATEQDIHTGIVVGRLQHIGLVGFNKYINLKRRLRIVNDAE